jgi:hypothetical protein
MTRTLNAENRAWNLESFLDSLIGELDRAQDTLALKGVNRPLTYTVKDVALDLQLFPVYTGDGVLFATARPGETGSSKVSIQLGSISDRQIRETTRTPVSKDDVTVDALPDLDIETKKSLKKVGIHTASDLERMETKNIDLAQAGGPRLDYRNLAGAIAKVRRQTSRPLVDKVSLAQTAGQFVLAMNGRNLVLGDEHADFPIALINRKPAVILSADAGQLQLSVAPEDLQPGTNELAIALDPYSIIRLEVQA